MKLLTFISAALAIVSLTNALNVPLTKNIAKEGNAGVYSEISLVGRQDLSGALAPATAVLAPATAVLAPATAVALEGVIQLLGNFPGVAGAVDAAGNPVNAAADTMNTAKSAAGDAADTAEDAAGDAASAAADAAGDVVNGATGSG
ncbi:hypothetical protein C8F04DRAFT_1394389 [Mycena alexandri]|uniref:Uncharacterized protein n=1 Tax=Mycena alexandri TaxID=1745969 RepID=A0AAD6T2I3_9AGAR|nr:hypothetical protein C8F04DRAFT_1394389 [Mycena alexandri]